MKKFEITDPFLSAFSKNWIWFLIWGLLLIILGMLAIYTAFFTTIISVIFLGGLLLAGGVIIIIDTFHFWWRQWIGFFPNFFMGLLYSILGLILIFGPVTAAITLTLLLGIFFVAIGGFRIYQALIWKLPRWKWALLNGVLTAILGVLILMQWPLSGLFIIGLFVGIDLIMIGWTYVLLSYFAKNHIAIDRNKTAI